ncbi:MAG: deaminase [Chryseobacterium sp.]
MMNWNLRFLNLAKHVSEWSKDPSTQVGAVIFDDKNRIVSIGYNGFPKNVADDPNKYADRNIKYKMVVHAEINAILFAQRDVSGCSIATYPFMPCSNCASVIIQSGIRNCIAPKIKGQLAERWSESCELASNMFGEAGVDLILYDF